MSLSLDNFLHAGAVDGAYANHVDAVAEVADVDSVLGGGHDDAAGDVDNFNILQTFGLDVDDAGGRVGVDVHFDVTDGVDTGAGVVAGGGTDGPGHFIAHSGHCGPAAAALGPASIGIAAVVVVAILHKQAHDITCSVRSCEADPEVLGLIQRKSAADVHGLPAFAVALHCAGVNLSLGSSLTALIDIEGIVHGTDSVEFDVVQVLAASHELSGEHGTPCAGGAAVETESGACFVNARTIGHGVAPVPAEDMDVDGFCAGTGGVGHGEGYGVVAVGGPTGGEGVAAAAGGEGVAGGGPADVGHGVNTDDVGSEGHLAAVDYGGGTLDVDSWNYARLRCVVDKAIDVGDSLGSGLVDVNAPIFTVDMAEIATGGDEVNGRHIASGINHAFAGCAVDDTVRHGIAVAVVCPVALGVTASAVDVVQRGAVVGLNPEDAHIGHLVVDSLEHFGVVETVAGTAPGG